LIQFHISNWKKLGSERLFNVTKTENIRHELKDIRYWLI